MRERESEGNKIREQLRTYINDDNNDDDDDNNDDDDGDNDVIVRS